MAGWRGSVAVAVCVAMLGVGDVSAELRPALGRPEVVEIGDPMLIEREVLRREMRMNLHLEEFIHLYGWPDYAEVQEVRVDEPFAAYEVRLYYIDRDQYYVFGRAHVAPGVRDFGIKKFEGHIPPGSLERLLTVGALAVHSEMPEPEIEIVEIVEAAEVVESEAAMEEVVPVEEEAPEAAESVDDGEGGGLEQVIQRLEAAADRAALAATLAERASLAAVSSADRATQTLDRVAEAYEQ